MQRVVLSSILAMFANFDIQIQTLATFRSLFAALILSKHRRGSFVYETAGVLQYTFNHRYRFKDGVLSLTA